MPKKNNPYELVQKSDKTYEFVAFGDIGESYWDETISAKEVVRQLGSVQADEIILRINSFGGSVSDGLAIYNALQSHGAKIITQNEGVAVSIAGYMFMAGSERRAYQNSMYMIHSPASPAYGNAKQLRSQAEVLDKFSEAEISTFTQKTNLSEEEVRQLLTDGEDHWYTAQEAFDMGFVTQIIEQDAHVDESFIASQYFKNAPAQLVQSLKPAMAKRITQSDDSSAHAEPNNPPKEAIMPEEVKSSAKPEQKLDESAIKQKAVEEFKQRSRAIRQAVSAASLDQTYADELIESEASIDSAREQVLQKLSESQPKIDQSVNVKFNNGREDAFRKDVVQGLSARAGADGVEANQFSKMGFGDLARFFLEQAGVRVSGMSTDEIKQAAITHSRGDFSIVLEDSMNKTLMSHYAKAPNTWRKFCGTGDLKDFRPHNRYKPSSFSDLQLLNENGEFKSGNLGDAEKETITASSKGVMFSLTHQMLVDDDMGYFLSVMRDMGIAAARSVEKDVFSLLTSNPVMADGNSLFHANHGNLVSSGTAIGMTALDAARVLMSKQMDPGGNDYLDVRPSVLLCPVEKGGLARQTIASETDPSGSNSKKPNIVRDMAEVVDTPRLSGNAWYLFADPSVMPAIEVGFLNGVQAPEVRTEESFGSRGIRYRIAFDYGVAAVEYRSAVRNPGE